MRGLIQKGHEAHVIFPDAGFASEDLNEYYEQTDRFSILKFPATYQGEHLYTFPLIITDPHPRNFKEAWTFKDLTQEQMDAYIGYFQEITEKVIADFKPDIIECQHIWIMDHVIKKMGHDYISVAHHSDQMGFHYDERMRPYAISAAQESSHIIAISESVKEEVLELYSVGSEKVTVIPNGYDKNCFRPRQIDKIALLKQFDLLQYRNLPMITFAGKISKTKGVDYLLKANKIIQNKREVLFVIFGAGSFEDVIETDMQHEYEFHNVVAMGHQSPQVLSSFHNIAHLSVMPSRSEGFGIAALEAMGCGIPVVASESGGLSDFVIGATTSVGDIQDLACQILKFLDMPRDKYREICNASLEKAKEYCWEEIVTKRLNIYETFL